MKISNSNLTLFRLDEPSPLLKLLSLKAGYFFYIIKNYPDISHYNYPSRTIKGLLVG